MSSYFCFNEGEFSKMMYSFSEFISLKESVEPKETEYGTDGHDGNWNTKDNFAYTFFSHSPSHHVCVSIHKHYGTLGFGVKKGQFSTDASEYDEGRTGLKDSLRVFNKVANVAVKGAIAHKIPVLRFHGADAKLNHTYDMITKNKHFNNAMSKHGFEYAGQHKSNFMFKNKNEGM
jgi:hypothetical protein